MTIREALNGIEGLKPNTYDESMKVAWLSALDMRIHQEIVLTHAHESDEESFSGYTEQTDKDTELLVKAPYDELYLYYLESKIDYSNGEMGKYNNSAAMFNATYTGYVNYINRTKMPICKGGIRYF